MQFFLNAFVLGRVFLDVVAPTNNWCPFSILLHAAESAFVVTINKMPSFLGTRVFYLTQIDQTIDTYCTLWYHT
jgi:uncharacterized membrane protein